MKYSLISAATLLALAGLGHASEPTDLDGAKTPAGQVVAIYLAKEWGAHKDRAGAAKLESPSMVDHGNIAITGPRPVATSTPRQEPAFAADAEPVITPLKIIVQGDLVFVQGVGHVGNKGNGDLMWVLYRVKDGLITEHWDVHTPIPDDQVGKQW